MCTTTLRILKCLLITSLLLVCFAKAAANSVEINDKIAKRCINPNGRRGYCISIHNCESLKYVLRNRITKNYRFVRLSQCENLMMSDSTPHVCCTNDNCFIDRRDRIVFERIIFPYSGSTTTATSLPIVPTNTPVNHRNYRTSYPEIVTQPINSLSEEESLDNETKSEEKREESSDEKTEESSENLAIFPKPPDCGAITISTKIYGGIEAELTEFSWMVNLEYRKENGEIVSVCAGSLINSRYVLTAAHCIKGKIEQKVGQIVSIRLGEHNTETEVDCNSFGCIAPFERVGFESITVHAEFDASRSVGIRQHNDIALIRLDRAINFTDSIQPVCLPNVEPMSELVSGKLLTVAGWGHNGTVKQTAEKHKVSLPLWDQAQCREKYSKSLYVADEQLCAGGVFRMDSCGGDSGGPLMSLNGANWILEGIVSFGRGCGLEQPGIYTRVSSYIDWIIENVKP